jgi:hypothetical protein
LSDDLGNREAMMPIWKLTPIDLSDPNWEASSHRGATVVRAPSEAAARKVAAAAFDVPTHFPARGGAKFPPWHSPSLVKAEEIEDPRYEEKGPSEVLDPSF